VSKGTGATQTRSAVIPFLRRYDLVVITFVVVLVGVGVLLVVAAAAAAVTTVVVAIVVVMDACVQGNRSYTDPLSGYTVFTQVHFICDVSL